MSPANQKTLFVTRKRTEWDLFAAAYHARIQAAEGRNRLSGQLRMSVPYDTYEIVYNETVLGERLRVSCRVQTAGEYHFSVSLKDWFDKIWFALFPPRVKSGSREFSKQFVVDTNKPKETGAWLSSTQLPGFLARQRDFTFGLAKDAHDAPELYLELHKKIDSKQALEEIFGVMCIALDALTGAKLIEQTPSSPGLVDIH